MRRPDLDSACVSSTIRFSHPSLSLSRNLIEENGGWKVSRVIFRFSILFRSRLYSPIIPFLLPPWYPQEKKKFSLFGSLYALGTCISCSHHHHHHLLLLLYQYLISLLWPVSCFEWSRKMGVDHADKMQSYIEALEEERRKILVFRRELPLCLELVTQAIGSCKQQLAEAGVTECNNNGNAQSECSEQTSTEGTPVLEEFIPMKRPSGSEDDEEEEQFCYKQIKTDEVSNANDEKSSSADSKKKSDWLRSAQLWNQTPDPPQKEEHQPPRKVPVVEVKRNGGAFQPFHRDQTGSAKRHQSSEKPHSLPPTAATSSNTKTDSNGRREEKEPQAKTHTQTQRKQRRCWSPELHRRFLQALQQLGGSHAATPKQIRELMKVDGLTNDEVKSHLQKYRLHTRRPSPSCPTIHSSSSSQQPQIVVVGGIWVPPPEYTAAAATEVAKTTPANGIYAPVVAPPPPAAALPEVGSTKNTQSEGRCSRSSHAHSSPSSTSSSSHTITDSPL